MLQNVFNANHVFLAAIRSYKVVRRQFSLNSSTTKVSWLVQCDKFIVHKINSEMLYSSSCAQNINIAYITIIN